jgi:undecaprenyl diphosphate synthase
MTNHEKAEPLSLEKLPQHVAIIMDGNGRWAKARGLPRVYGHRKGVETARKIVLKSQEIGIKYLSLFTFSKENWQRPEAEIQALFQLLEEYLIKELPTMKEKGIRLRVMGDKEDLPENLQEVIDLAEKETRANEKLHLILAISYGGRAEILQAARKLVEKIKKRNFFSDLISEELFRQFLYLPDVPDPDLLIRTGGEMRISNFYLFQLAYTELYFTPVLWPDFTEDEYLKALLDFQRRERRFGKVYEL